jgi:hypothetical protein
MEQRFFATLFWANIVASYQPKVDRPLAAMSKLLPLKDMNTMSDMWDVFAHMTREFLKTGICSEWVRPEVMELISKTEGGASHWARDHSELSSGAKQAYLEGLTLKYWYDTKAVSLDHFDFSYVRKYVEEHLKGQAEKYLKNQYTDGGYSDFECQACFDYRQLHLLVEKKRQVYLQTLCTEEDAG